MTDRPAPDHWFEPLADHLGSAYLRYSFTKGTEQEVAFLVDALDVQPGNRVLDVGCGPGRHAHALAARGVEVVGIDISQRFIDIATERTPAEAPATFVRMDARDLSFDREFDAAISLCQGAFGLVGPGADVDVLEGIARALVPGGRSAISAFSSYFQVQYPQESGTFDIATGVHHERTVIKDEAGNEADVGSLDDVLHGARARADRPSAPVSSSTTSGRSSRASYERRDADDRDTRAARARTQGDSGANGSRWRDSGGPSALVSEPARKGLACRAVAPGSARLRVSQPHRGALTIIREGDLLVRPEPRPDRRTRRGRTHHTRGAGPAGRS